jgi:hypothetical protein
MKSSITQTVNAAYPHAISTGGAVPSTADGVIFKFDLSDFDPTIRFAPGFFVPTADANVEIAVQARVTDKAGKELITTTFHGHGHASEDGACGVGADALGDAAKKAIQARTPWRISWTRSSTPEPWMPRRPPPASK